MKTAHWGLMGENHQGKSQVAQREMKVYISVLKDFNFCFMHMNKTCMHVACMSVHHVHAWCPQRPEKVVWILTLKFRWL